MYTHIFAAFKWARVYHLLEKGQCECCPFEVINTLDLGIF